MQYGQILTDRDHYLNPGVTMYVTSCLCFYFIFALGFLPVEDFFLA
jgi:hypothetical protein